LQKYPSKPSTSFLKKRKRLNLETKAKQLELPSFIIQDAGRTSVAPGSRTVLGIFGIIQNNF